LFVYVHLCCSLTLAVLASLTVIQKNRSRTLFGEPSWPAPRSLSGLSSVAVEAGSWVEARSLVSDAVRLAANAIAGKLSDAMNGK
jgi:hypothetical protein